MAQKSEEKDYKEMYEFYKSFETDITDERMLTAMYAHKEDPNNKDFSDFCIASYICSDEDTRGFLEEKLGKDDLAIETGKDILNGVGKEPSKTQKQVKKQSRNSSFVGEEKVRQR